MPIKHENKHRYPADWQAIRGRILERAKWRCEHPGCKARQYSVGWWARNGAGLCARCATQTGPDLHLCPDHAAAPAQKAMEF